MLQCPDCPKYSTCTELCDEAEAYVNQDYASMGKGGVFVEHSHCHGNPRGGTPQQNDWLDVINFRSGLPEVPPMTVDMEVMDDILDNALTDFQRSSIIKYFVDGKKMSEIAEEEGITRQAVGQRILWAGKRLRKLIKYRKFWKKKIVPNLLKLTEKQSQIALLYFHEGLSAEDIAKHLRCHKFTITRHVLNIRNKVSGK